MVNAEEGLDQMFHKHRRFEGVLFVNTLLQRGVLRMAKTQNRFN